MKNIFLLTLLFLILLLSNTVYTQKFDLGLSYGLAYTDLNYDQPEGPINYGFPKIGSFLNFEFDYKLTKSRYIGLGFSTQQHQNSLNFNGDLGSGQTSFELQNYQNIYQKNIYDVHFRKIFENNLQLSFGVFFFHENFNEIRIESADNQPIFVYFKTNNSADNLGLFVSLDYMWHLNNFVDAGLKGRVYYSIDGIDTIVLTPSVRVKF